MQCARIGQITKSEITAVVRLVSPRPAGSMDKTVRIWDVVTGECEQTLQGHSFSVSSASFSPDGTKVVSGSLDKTVRIWDAVTGECEQTLQGHSDSVMSASFSPDGLNVVSGSFDRTVRLW